MSSPRRMISSEPSPSRSATSASFSAPSDARRRLPGLPSRERTETRISDSCCCAPSQSLADGPAVIATALVLLYAGPIGRGEPGLGERPGVALLPLIVLALAGADVRITGGSAVPFVLVAPLVPGAAAVLLPLLAPIVVVADAIVARIRRLLPRGVARRLPRRGVSPILGVLRRNFRSGYWFAVVCGAVVLRSVTGSVATTTLVVSLVGAARWALVIGTLLAELRERWLVDARGRELQRRSAGAAVAVTLLHAAIGLATGVVG